MRDAVISLYRSSGTPNRDVQTRFPLGFQPVPRIGEGGADAGVGIWPGKLRFLESNSITTAPGDRNEAFELVPDLEEPEGTFTPLDAEIPPRKYLVAGDYEAWVIWRELGDEDHIARIEFTAEDDGPGTLDRDEKAERLATFEVYYPDTEIETEGEVPGLTIKEQFIRDGLAIWTERHQFKARKTDDDKVKIDPGWVIFPAGRSDPLVAGSGYDITQETSAQELTITEAGSIFLKIHWTVTQLSTSTAGDHTLVMRRLYSISAPLAEFRATTNPYSIGTDDENSWTDGYMYYEVCKLSFADGETFVTDQILNGPIYLPELNDAIIEGAS
jgi:hypothetical protein